MLASHAVGFKLKELRAEAYIGVLEETSAINRNEERRSGDPL